MRRNIGLLCVCLGAFARAATTPTPEEPIAGILRLFETHSIVMLGEIHESTQEHDLLRRLVAAPSFPDRVDDIVVEFGNARYQDVVDRYIDGEAVSMAEAQPAWRNTLAVGPISPLYGEFFAAVRRANAQRPKERRVRIVLGDPPVDWNRVQSRRDLGPFLPFRDVFFASVVRYQVVAKKRRALLIMGAAHFQRTAGRPGAIERELLTALVKPYVIIPGTNMVGGFDDLDARFDALPAPELLEMKGSWVGALPVANARGGVVETWEQTADSYLYLGPRDSLTRLRAPRRELDGTSYGKEVARRLQIMFDTVPEFMPTLGESAEQPAFSRTSGPPPPPLPSIPQPLP